MIKQEIQVHTINGKNELASNSISTRTPKQSPTDGMTIGSNKLPNYYKKIAKFDFLRPKRCWNAEKRCKS